MVASTISSERETTQVRRRKRANQCRCRALLFSLRCARLVLADVVPADRQGGAVGRPVVGAEQPHAPGLQAGQQAVERDPVAVAALPVDQAAGRALERLPDPELAGLFWTRCQTSSSSTTVARPAGSGFGQ